MSSMLAGLSTWHVEQASKLHDVPRSAVSHHRRDLQKDPQCLIGPSRFGLTSFEKLKGRHADDLQRRARDLTAISAQESPASPTPRSGPTTSNMAPLPRRPQFGSRASVVGAYSIAQAIASRRGHVIPKPASAPPDPLAISRKLAADTEGS